MADRYLHADGGLYRMAGPGKLKCPATGEWHDAVFYYSDSDGTLLATTKVRWEERFKRVTPTGRTPTPPEMQNIPVRTEEVKKLKKALKKEKKRRG